MGWLRGNGASINWEQGTTSLVATVISIIVGIISLVLTYKWRRDWVVNGEVLEQPRMEKKVKDDERRCLPSNNYLGRQAGKRSLRKDNSIGTEKLGLTSYHVTGVPKIGLSLCQSQKNPHSSSPHVPGASDPFAQAQIQPLGQLSSSLAGPQHSRRRGACCKFKS